MKLKFLFILIGINLIFLFAGGLIYHFIEYPHEERAIENSKTNYDELLSRLSGEYILQPSHANGLLLTVNLQFPALYVLIIVRSCTFSVHVP